MCTMPPAVMAHIFVQCTLYTHTHTSYPQNALCLLYYNLLYKCFTICPPLSHHVVCVGACHEAWCEYPYKYQYTYPYRYECLLAQSGINLFAFRPILLYSDIGQINPHQVYDGYIAYTTRSSWRHGGSKTLTGIKTANKTKSYERIHTQNTTTPIQTSS